MKKEEKDEGDQDSKKLHEREDRREGGSPTTP